MSSTCLLSPPPPFQVADYRVNTFSGGMKRRLSVALSFLGDPKIMFLGNMDWYIQAIER